jgi:type IV fimbrial biogenesis protein FimT
MSMRALARPSRGFTLIELLVVLTLTAILAAVAAPAFTGTMGRTAVRGTASSLQLDMMRARSEAARRNSSVTMAPVGGSWQNGWQLRDAGGTLINDQGAVKTSIITTSVLSIVYMSSGRIRGATVPSFQISATRGGITRCVSASLNGRPYVKDSAC